MLQAQLAKGLRYLTLLPVAAPLADPAAEGPHHLEHHRVGSLDGDECGVLGLGDPVQVQVFPYELGVSLGEVLDLVQQVGVVVLLFLPQQSRVLGGRFVQTASRCRLLYVFYRYFLL